MKMEIKGFEVVEDESGKHIEHSTEILEIPDDQVRDEDICTICGSPIYPECKKICHNFESEGKNENKD